MNIPIATRRRFMQAVAGGALAANASAASKRPNIVLMMADDMGFSDLGCYGGEIRTPNLDRLAGRGIRFTQFYNTARCCPTRSSLMTGLYAHQAGVGHMVNPRPLPGYAGDLNRRCVTIAEALKPAGYRTAMSGKWHVTPANQSKHNWPLQRGFDRYFGIIHGAANYFDPEMLVDGNDVVDERPKDFYLTDAIGNRATQYIDESAANTDPFFLYVAFTSPHWPLHAIEGDVDRYQKRYNGGWDALRNERHRRMIELGIVDKRWPLTPRDPRAPAWNDAPNREWYARRMEVYAAQVDRMDQNVGRILSKLREKGLEDDTLVMFLADNGGCAEELGAQSRNPKVTRDGRPVRFGNDPSVMPGAADTFQSYGLPWANASNTPFRLYKHWVHEGGISTPFIASWAGRMGQRGQITNQPGHLIDVMATCLDVSGARYPQTYQGNAITPLEGRPLTPVLEGKRREGHTEGLYWEHEGNRAVRQDNWKLVSRYPDRWELYDLAADRTEMSDLAARSPRKAEQLASRYQAWAQRAGVVPWDQVVKKSG